MNIAQIGRRDFIKTAGLATTEVLFGSCQATKTSIGSRPNVVVIFTDDQRWDCMGCMGNSDVKTPNCDQLAREGVLFENAFHSSPICEPCRASVLLGQHLSVHRCGFDMPTNPFFNYFESNT